jgi:hypothetical protein
MSLETHGAEVWGVFPTPSSALGISVYQLLAGDTRVSIRWLWDIIAFGADVFHNLRHSPNPGPGDNHHKLCYYTGMSGGCSRVVSLRPHIPENTAVTDTTMNAIRYHRGPDALCVMLGEDYHDISCMQRWEDYRACIAMDGRCARWKSQGADPTSSTHSTQLSGSTAAPGKSRILGALSFPSTIVILRQT